uniref:Uncharacterized protein n=1 Tax=Molossus molossus TaxID=27622 RepID=A0A7J8GKS2_MOLMO|nr:hypothetical protein HJG59_011441 [Molossus molossus]
MCFPMARNFHSGSSSSIDFANWVYVRSGLKTDSYASYNIRKPPAAPVLFTEKPKLQLESRGLRISGETAERLRRQGVSLAMSGRSTGAWCHPVSCSSRCRRAFSSSAALCPGDHREDLAQRSSGPETSPFKAEE